MKIHIESEPDFNSGVIDSLLSTLSELLLPVSVIDEIIVVLKESLIEYAADVGNTSCDVIEHIHSTADITKLLSIQRAEYAKLQDVAKCLSKMEAYRKAAIAAGAK